MCSMYAPSVDSSCLQTNKFPKLRASHSSGGCFSLQLIFHGVGIKNAKLKRFTAKSFICHFNCRLESYSGELKYTHVRTHTQKHSIYVCSSDPLLFIFLFNLYILLLWDLFICISSESLNDDSMRNFK